MRPAFLLISSKHGNIHLRKEMEDLELIPLLPLPIYTPFLPFTKNILCSFTYEGPV